MSLPPYKHRRNPCLHTEKEPLILGLAGAPLITHKCIQEKRRTSDQRVARIQDKPDGVEFEYEYVPGVQSTSAKRTVFNHQIDDPCDQHYPGDDLHPDPANIRSAKKRGSPGASGDEISSNKEVRNCSPKRNDNAISKNVEDREYSKNKDDNDDAKSVCSRRSGISNCSRSTQNTELSRKSQRSSTKRCSDIRQSKISSGQDQGTLGFQKFGRIANGLDDDDLRPRRC